MRFLYCTNLYPAYIRHFYGVNPLLELESFDVQMQRLDEHAFGWVGAWKEALAPFGYEVHELLYNAAPLQRTWAWENDRRLLSPEDLTAIAVEQARRIRPEVMFFDLYEEPLLKAIRAAVPELRLVIGWVGGTVPAEVGLWREFDLVLSCAPESVEWLRTQGIASAHLHHGFNHRVLDHIEPHGKPRGAAFFGQIVTSGAFHGAREQFFESLADAGLGVEIFSPSYEFGAREDLYTVAKIGAWGAVQALRAAGASELFISRLPVLRRAARWSERPAMPVSRKLKPWLRPGVYGLDMFQAVSDSKVVLNAHADASIRYASNMRLFEVTGAGTCLLTDWRENIHELFEPDKEIVTYRSLTECIEKVRWLLDHPADCAAIGKAAQARALRDHTYARRAARLDEIIRSARGGGERA
jgi:spore maturation protein CgeB